MALPLRRLTTLFTSMDKNTVDINTCHEKIKTISENCNIDFPTVLSFIPTVELTEKIANINTPLD